MKQTVAMAFIASIINICFASNTGYISELKSLNVNKDPQLFKVDSAFSIKRYENLFLGSNVSDNNILQTGNATEAQITYGCLAIDMSATSRIRIIEFNNIGTNGALCSIDWGKVHVDFNSLKGNIDSLTILIPYNNTFLTTVYSEFDLSYKGYVKVLKGTVTLGREWNDKTKRLIFGDFGSYNSDIINFINPVTKRNKDNNKPPVTPNRNRKEPIAAQDKNKAPKPDNRHNNGGRR